MNTEATSEILVSDLAHTEVLAKKIATNLRGGEVFELVSDLGGGKTTFVRCIASALGYLDVSSPSFTIHNIYKTENLELHHYDFYRLDDPGVVAMELKEMLLEPHMVTFIEWGERIEGQLPADRIVIRIIQDVDEARRFQFYVPESRSYILEGVS